MVTEYNGQGFPVVVTQTPGQAKSYDNQGFLVTSAPATPAPSKTGVAKAADTTTGPSASGINVVKVVSGAAPTFSGEKFKIIGAFCALFGGFLF